MVSKQSMAIQPIALPIEAQLLEMVFVIELTKSPGSQNYMNMDLEDVWHHLLFRAQ